ncbi:hypothetical protein AGOR_G00124240 [Albula goreensis]|uniref:Uncharacterized protein n=1 Tax=Albula goreensis TaxID=1534307 RepID=A0A8T3DEU0_9TELE|nr:hypothetical protein AGOR_G00124240 [Albula goreensis]
MIPCTRLLEVLQLNGDVMSRIPMGKVLLRNVIRHTDAHNKIQEESEMWKLRDMERQAVGDQVVLHRRKSTQNHRGKMHCDRFLEDTPASTQNRAMNGRHATGHENCTTLRPAIPTGGDTVGLRSSIQRNLRQMVKRSAAMVRTCNSGRSGARQTQGAQLYQVTEELTLKSVFTTD